MMEDLTLSEAARELGISRQRLAVIASEGRLGRQVAGHYWIFTRTDVEAFRPNIQGKAGRPKSEIEVTMENRTPALASA